MVGLILLLIGSGAALLMVGWSRQVRARAGSIGEQDFQRLVAESGLAGNTDMRQRVQDTPSLVSRLAKSFMGSTLSRSRESQEVLSWLERQLVLAGRPKGWSAPEALMFALMFWAAGAALTLLLVFSLDAPKWLAAFIFGAMVVYPPSKLRSLRLSRQQDAVLELPGFLSDLQMALSSGLTTLDDAFARVVNVDLSDVAVRDQVLVREFGQAFAEYRRGGRDREQALRAAAARIGVAPVADMVDAIVQGLRTGAPIRDVLIGQANQVEAIYREEVRAFIGKKETNLIFSLVITMMGVVVLIVAPVMLEVVAGLNGS